MRLLVGAQHTVAVTVSEVAVFPLPRPSRDCSSYSASSPFLSGIVMHTSEAAQPVDRFMRHSCKSDSRCAPCPFDLNNACHNKKCAETSHAVAQTRTAENQSANRRVWSWSMWAVVMLVVNPG